MENNFTKRLIDKRKELKISAPKLAKLLNVNTDSIYKWEKGTQPRDFNLSGRLEKFLNGVFDQFVSNGNLIEGYTFDKAIAIIYPRDPTNDFADGGFYNSLREKIPRLKELELQVRELEIDLREVRHENMQLKEQLEKKSKVIPVGKTGGRRN